MKPSFFTVLTTDLPRVGGSDDEIDNTREIPETFELSLSKQSSFFGVRIHGSNTDS